MKSPYILSFFLILSSIAFSQQTYDDIFREIDSKKKELEPYYSKQRLDYKTKQDVINQNYNTKVNEITSLITSIDAKIKVLEDGFSKYKKQSSLYNSFKSFCNENRAYRMNLYTNLSDCKKIKKVYTNKDDFKNVDLIFAVWASNYSNTSFPGTEKYYKNRDLDGYYNFLDGQQYQRDVLLFWSDSTISISRNYNSYLPLLTCKLKEFGFENYNSSNYISNELNIELFNKMVNYLNFEKAQEINLKMEELSKEKKSLTENLILEKSSFENEISKYSLDSLQFHRLQDSMKLLELEIYYKSEIEKQIEINKLIPLNYAKYKTNKVNGVEVFNAPLSMNQFRNGDPILLARTQSEWEKFMKSNTPAYKFEDFDEKNASYGFIYNYHAYIDSREIAPYGYHKINLQDYNYLENQIVFNSTISENCNSCTNGKEDVYEWCSHCNHWTKEQKKYNVCKYCNNNSLKITGKKTCSICNGTGKFKSISLKQREIPIYPGSSKYKGLWMDGFDKKYISKVDYDGRLTEISEKTIEYLKNTSTGYYWDTTEYYWAKESVVAFQVFICKDREINKTKDNFKTKQIGNLELMSDFLNVMNVTTFKNGDPIKYIDDPIEWELAFKNKIPAYCYYLNQPNSNWIIYNDIALNDPRGIIPNGWRKITHADELHLSFSLGFEFDWRSQFIYGKDSGPGPVFCVRDAQIKSNMLTQKKYTLFIGPLFQPKDVSIGVSNENIQENISKSKLQITNKYADSDWRNKFYLPDEKSPITEYSSYYNNSGVEVIKTLVETNFNYLFQENPKLKIIGLPGLLKCIDGQYQNEYNSSFNGSGIIGLIIEPGTNNQEIKCTYKKNLEVSSSIFYRSGDFTFTNEHGFDLTFHFYPFMNCQPSNNPLENFFIEFDNYYGIDSNWITRGKFSDPYGDFKEDVVPRLREINQFFENH